MNELLYNDFTTLERAIISCLLIKPELTDQLIVEPKHFKQYRSLLLFMKQFYKNFKNYDFNLMAVVCVDKYNIVGDICELVQIEPTTAHFNQYQEQLIKLYNGEIEEKKNIQAILNLATKLKSREISVEEFRNEVEKI